MGMVVNGLIALIVIEHIWFLILEMFLWSKPLGLKTFKMTQQVADSSATLAANQGLYNGFLAAGLLYALCCATGDVSHSFKVFFLGCVAVAGAYGGYTVSSKIFFMQCIPALIALALIFFS